ncbi:MAG: hypothetical protein FWF51_09205 [Chitinivibrionia bacterium]|nr:hypothetical protein [Chitinivibrionia bacterium]
MKLNFLFLTKFLVCGFLAFCTFAFVGCSDGDVKELVDGYGKTGEIVGVFEEEFIYESPDYGKNPAKMTITLRSNKSGTFVVDRGSNFNVATVNFTWTNDENTIAMKKNKNSGDSNYYDENAAIVFDGLDALTYTEHTLKRKNP